ncbi:unnamed protein product, partial [Hapterophycus canaliculatus]
MAAATAAAATTTAAAATTSATVATAATKKRRCWQFHVSGVSPTGTQAQQQSALASFTDKYTAAKRLTIIPVHADPAGTIRKSADGSSGGTEGTSNTREAHAAIDAGGNNGCGGDGDGDASNSGSVVVEVQFSGPQPAERPALLLRNLLGGKSVAAHPVLLRRGRSKKPTEAAAA